jgi:non-heme chloroperoxidase
MRRWVVISAAAAVGLGVGVAVARSRRVVIDLHDFDRAEPTTDLGGQDHVLISADGAELLVHVAGPDDGPVVVLAHCWTGSQQTWAPVTRRLVAAGCRVVRWDQRGHGRSIAGHKGHSVEALADDLACVLTELDLRDAVLAGHSMGGMTVQALAAHDRDLFHDRTRAIVLVATAAHGLNNSPVAVLTPLLGAAALERAMGRPAVGQSFVRGTFGKTAHPHHLEVTRADFLATPAQVRVDFIVSIQDMDLREQVARIDVPATILCGSRDTLTPLPLSRALAAVIPGAVLEVLPGYGHMLPYEAPDVVSDAVLAHVVAPARVS